MSQINKPLISVIVPIYKVEEYLHRCVDSIVNQSYTNLEIILVDDGSPDRCGEICDEYVQKDERVKVIHKENGGLSDARNVAIESAQGEFLTFIDSDDYVDMHYIEYMYRVMANCQVDCVLCDFQKFSHTKILNKDVDFCEYQILPSMVALEMILYQNKLDPAAWAKLYKRQVFNNLRYPKGMLYEDLALIYDIMRNCSSIAFLPLQLYFYYQRPNSILGRFCANRLDVLDIVDEIVNRCEKEQPFLLPAAKSRKLSANFNMFLLMPQTKEYELQRDRCWNNIKKLRMEMLFSMKIRLKNRVGILLSFLGRHIFMVFKKINSLLIFV